MTALTDYRRAVEQALLRGNATEHTYRPALKVLVEALKAGVIATNEPRRVDCGAPDYIVTRGQVPLGHIEAKDIGVSLNDVEKSEQGKRYLAALGNLVITDYLEFRWYVKGERRMTARLATLGTRGRLEPAVGGADEVQALLMAFLDSDAATVNNAKELATRMAALTRLLRDAVTQAFDGEGDAGVLHSQYGAFRETLLHDLQPPQFADMYAQTIAYGLFAAACTPVGGRQSSGAADTGGRQSSGAAQPFTRRSAAWDLPKTNPFLRSLFGLLAGPELDDEPFVWAVDDLAALLDRADMGAVLEGFGRKTARQDPVLHFYETFLAAYDPKMRELRGVYYTPEPVVSYIVRSVDHLLKTEFGLPDGLADRSTVKVKDKDGVEHEVPRVLILDPACGTGTFLHEVIALIHDRVQTTTGGWTAYVKAHLLPRIFGFELLMAPYAVAHMKLALQLADTGYDVAQEGGRLNVFLTNTLEEAHAAAQQGSLAYAITKEAAEADKVKGEFPVMVVLGNPPYSGHSANKGPWITGLLHGMDSTSGKTTGSYFHVDGQPLDEKNPKWLNDDYVKFIRFAQWRIEQTGYGILAFISNNGYLDNPTFRGMRKSLLDTFDDIRVLDLHGNSKKKERTPDGGKDENVFDIQQGVAIGIMSKPIRQVSSDPRRANLVKHDDFWGTRETKSTALRSADPVSQNWAVLDPASPAYRFAPGDDTLEAEYALGTELPTVFPMGTAGMVTANDALTVRWTAEDAWRTVSTFLSLSPEDARTRLSLGPDTRDWKVELAQRDLRRSGPSHNRVVQVVYRPFDIRYLYYTETSRGFICRPRGEVMSHMLAGPNLALITTRQTRDQWDAYVTSRVALHKSLAAYDINTVFPLYIYNGKTPPTLFSEHEVTHHRKPNLSPAFIADVERHLALTFIPDEGGDLQTTVGPEDIFAYLYAVFHAPGYRTRYAEFLKRDFPRLPLTSDITLFRALCALGQQLVDLHLMEKPGSAPARFCGSGGGYLVERVHYTPPIPDAPEGRVWINATQYFAPVPPEVWATHIGGYQVCDKWLKDRKDRVLSYDDIDHYGKVVAALGDTIRLMTEIDAVIEGHGGWPMG